MKCSIFLLVVQFAHTGERGKLLYNKLQKRYSPNFKRKNKNPIC